MEEPVPEHHGNDKFAGVDAGRRSFIVRFAAAVFAVPAVSSFALDGIARAASDHREFGNSSNYGGQRCGNQTVPNQYMHNQHVGNQSWGNQHIGNQSWGNQHIGNQRNDQSPDFQRDRSGSLSDGDCFPYDNHHGRRGRR
jgi:hypothetical protein